MIECPHCHKQHEGTNHFCPIDGQPIPLDDRMAGQTLQERYEVLSFLGPWFAGGTYKVHDLADDGPPLLAKLIHPQHGRRSAELERFMADVKKGKGIVHPNVGKVVDTGKDHTGVSFVVREHVEGLRLKDIFEKGEELLELWQAVFVIDGILKGLTALHDAGVVHGRLGPGDVLFVKGGGGELVPKIVDFGEHLLEPFASDKDIRGMSNYLFQSPEKVRDAQTTDASDIYSAGVILYHLLTRKFPYPDGIPAKPAKMPGFAPVAELRPQLPGVIDYNLRSAMAIFPRDRFKNAAQFSEKLKGFLPDSPLKFDDFIKAAGMKHEHLAAAEEASRKNGGDAAARARQNTAKFQGRISAPPPAIAPLIAQKAAAAKANGPAAAKADGAPAPQADAAPPPPPAPKAGDAHDAWKEERKLVPRATGKTPAAPAAAAKEEPAVKVEPKPEPEAAKKPAAPHEPPPPPPAHAAEKKEEPKPGVSAPLIDERSQPRIAVRKLGKALPQEESLAPIMPARHAKWFVLAGVVVLLLVAAAMLKPIYFPAKKEAIKPWRTDQKKGDQAVKEEQATAAQQDEAAAAAQAAAVPPPPPEPAAPGGGTQPSSLLAGLVPAADAATGDAAPGEAAAPAVAAAADVPPEPPPPLEPVKAAPPPPVKHTVTLAVSPGGATVTIDGKKAKAPYRIVEEDPAKVHVVAVDAKGYVAREVSVVADQDRSVEIALEKKPPEPTVAKVVAPPPPPPAEEPKAAVKKTVKKKVKKAGGGKKGGGIEEEVPF